MKFWRPPWIWQALPRLRDRFQKLGYGDEMLGTVLDWIQEAFSVVCGNNEHLIKKITVDIRSTYMQKERDAYIIYDMYEIVYLNSTCT